ncbi:MAG TPA: hypothetical protein VJB14_09465 [Planctomycetota bacterium]|nr:hypothetical protein [Planctomycetota bacterium]
MRRTVLGLGASVALGLIGLGMQAQPVQEKKPETAPPSAAPPSAAPQEKAEFTGILDSWYKIIHLDKDVGHMRVVLDRVASGGNWRYTYTVDAETELMLPDPKDPGKQVPSVESLRIRAKLDDTYGPIDWQQTNHLDGIDLNTTINTDESGARKVEVVYSPTDRRPFPVSSEEDVFYSRFLMFIALRQNGNLARQGARKVSLLHVHPDGKSPFSEVEINIEPATKREYLGKKDVTVTRVLYRKPPPARLRDLELQEAYIDRYGRPVEEILRGGMKIILVRGEEEAIGKALLRQGARRDPFRKDLAMKFKAAKDGTGGPSRGEITVDPASFESRYKEAKGLVDELRKAKDENREADGDALYRKIIDYYDALKKSLAEKPQTAEVARQVEDLRKVAEEIWGGIDRLMKKLLAVNVSIMEAFGRDDCPTMEKGLEELRKAQDAKELRDQPQLIELAGWIAKADPLISKCRTRLELARKKLVLTGTISYEDWSVQTVDGTISLIGVQVGGVHGVRFIKPNRLAIVNDKVYKIGDVIEGEGVRVEKIWPHGVQVSLRDETRDVGIRQ